MKFCITFGNRYRNEVHPVLGNYPILPDGWMTIEAEDEITAREWLRDVLKSLYSSIYEEKEFFEGGHDAYFPRGCLGDVQKAEAVATPNCDQWKVVYEKAWDIEGFCNWLSHAGYEIAKWDENERLVPSYEPPMNLIYRYFDVDPDGLARERHALVKRLQKGGTE